MGHRLDFLSWGSPAGGPPLPELPCKVAPAGGRAVAGLKKQSPGNVDCSAPCVLRGKPRLGVRRFQHLLAL